MVDAHAIKQTVCKDARNVFATAIRVGYLQKNNNVIRVVVGVDRNMNLLPFTLYNKQNNMFYSINDEVNRRGLSNNYFECLRQLVAEKHVIYQHLANIQYFVVVDAKCRDKKFVQRSDGSYVADVGYFVCRSATNTLGNQQIWNLGKVNLTPEMTAAVNKTLCSRILSLASMFLG